MSLRRTIGLVALAALSSACAGEPSPGEYGVFRYVGNVRGATPLPLLPPISDRDGNVYVMFGARDVLEVGLFVGHRGGGWTGGCALSSPVTAQDNFGLHGFVGRAQSRAWYWSNAALVAASGSGSCSRVLPADPTSGSQLRFRAVLPWVRDTPSRTTLVAWIQATSDPRPYTAVIDLNVGRYTSLDEFEPSGASNIVVLGVGGNARSNEGVVVTRYELNGAIRVEARFFDHNGELLEIARLSGLDTLPPHGIVGYLQPDDSGLWAGLTEDGRLLVLDRSGGETKNVGGMAPVGVHRWEGQLYLVGEADGRPRFALIDEDGDVGDVERWETSLEAADLGSEIDVRDDRSPPSRQITWKNPRTAMGSFPFLHPHSLDHYADGTTTWLIAGPGFQVGGEDRTAIAMAPVGVRYE